MGYLGVEYFPPNTPVQFCPNPCSHTGLEERHSYSLYFLFSPKASDIPNIIARITTWFPWNCTQTFPSQSVQESGNLQDISLISNNSFVSCSVSLVFLYLWEMFARFQLPARCCPPYACFQYFLQFCFTPVAIAPHHNLKLGRPSFSLIVL